jgi:hypothetical protein
VAQFILDEAQSRSRTVACSSPANGTRQIVWLQGITLVWMLAECGVSLYAAISV